MTQLPANTGAKGLRRAGARPDLSRASAPFETGRARKLRALSLAAAAATVAAGITVYNGGLAGRPKARPEPPIASHLAPASNRVLSQALAAASFGVPVVGYEIISPFGLRQLPWELRPRLHAGVDIAAPQGTPALAVLQGVVTRMGRDDGYGIFVELEHAGGVRSLYAHLHSLAPGLNVGTRFERGAALGRIGSTGSSTGAHLHFELRSADGRPLDPFYFLGRDFGAAEEWPLQAALRISPRVRYAQFGSNPLARQELLIASREANLVDVSSGPSAAAEGGSQAEASLHSQIAAPDPGLQLADVAISPAEKVSPPPETASEASGGSLAPVLPPRPAGAAVRPRAAFPSSF